MHPTSGKVAVEDAERIAVSAITFLTEDQNRIGQFLELTGLTLSTMTSGTGQRDFFRAVLEHLLGDESLLLTFAANTGLDPAVVQSAHRALDMDQSGG